MSKKKPAAKKTAAKKSSPKKKVINVPHSLQAKLGSIVSHGCEVLVNPTAQAPRDALAALVDDPEVKEWMQQMEAQGLVPSPRSPEPPPRQAEAGQSHSGTTAAAAASAPGPASIQQPPPPPGGTVPNPPAT